MEAPIININGKFDRDRFLKNQIKKQTEKKQHNCNHNECTFDGEKDLVECDLCNKEWNCFDYMWFMIQKNNPVKNKIFLLENDIYFLTEEKRKLEDEIFYLKKERRALKVEITKMKKSI